MSTLRTNALEGVDAKNSITIVAGAVNGNDDHPYCSALTANRAYVTQTTSSFPFRSGYSGHNAASSSGDYADFFDPNGALVVAHGDLA